MDTGEREHRPVCDEHLEPACSRGCCGAELFGYAPALRAAIAAEGEANVAKNWGHAREVGKSERLAGEARARLRMAGVQPKQDPGYSVLLWADSESATVYLHGEIVAEDVPVLEMDRVDTRDIVVTLSRGGS